MNILKYTSGKEVHKHLCQVLQVIICAVAQGSRLHCALSEDLIFMYLALIIYLLMCMFVSDSNLFQKSE